MSAQHPNIFERLFGRKHEPQHTPWERFREEQVQDQQTDAMRLVAFLRAPANITRRRLGLPAPRQTGPIRPVPARGDVQLTMLARPVVTVHPVAPPAPKPEPRRYEHEDLIAMIRTQKPSPEEVARHLQHAEVTAIPQDHFLVAGPDMLFVPLDQVPTVTPLNASDRAAMAAAAEMPRQTTGYLDELATLRHNSDTLECPAYIKQKHTKESE